MLQALMFEFSAGAISLCLLDTVGDRGGQHIERLSTPADLARWLQQAALITDAHYVPTSHDLDLVRALRDATYCVYIALRSGYEPDNADIEIINSCARRPSPYPQWESGEFIYLAEDTVAAAIALIAADAIVTLARPLIDRVRSCPECTMVFVDRSNAGQRRWCSSVSRCGNRAKVREHRARQSVKLNKEKKA